MKELYYVIQTLIHGRGANLIKVISLTLGLTVSILIFAREAFEFNYDTCYEDSECLAAVQIEWNHNGEKDTGFMTMGPMAGAIARKFSQRSGKVPQQRISGGEELLFIRMTFVSVRVY